MTKLLIAILLMLSFGATHFAFAEETTGEKVEHQMDKASDNVKKSMRKADDKLCDATHDKNCVGKKLKHKTQNIEDATKTKVKEEKNKID